MEGRICLQLGIFPFQHLIVREILKTEKAGKVGGKPRRKAGAQYYQQVVQRCATKSRGGYVLGQLG